MKALYLPEMTFSKNQVVEVKDEDHHHLVTVQRLNKNEKILLLNGSGVGFYGDVLEITKKVLRLEIIEEKISETKPRHSVLIFAPKKDALDLMIKSSVEMSVKEILIVRGDHSVERLPDESKIQKMIKQGIEQSNSFHHHRLELTSLGKIDFTLYKSVNILDLVGDGASGQNKEKENQLVVVGPEGGFSESERDFLRNIPGANYITLPTNILRSPTALIAGLGWLYGKN
jgi:16S rRNA (uracil1498-N3)-methyltransferase